MYQMKSPIKLKSFKDVAISIRDLLTLQAGFGSFPQTWHKRHPANKRRLYGDSTETQWSRLIFVSLSSIFLTAQCDLVSSEFILIHFETLAWIATQKAK
jgi:hypothetical protein